MNLSVAYVIKLKWDLIKKEDILALHWCQEKSSYRFLVLPKGFWDAVNIVHQLKPFCLQKFFLSSRLNLIHQWLSLIHHDSLILALFFTRTCSKQLGCTYCGGRVVCLNITSQYYIILKKYSCLFCRFSKQAFLSDVAQPYTLSDNSMSFKDFMGSKNNRFINPTMASKNRIQGPSKVCLFFSKS